VRDDLPQAVLRPGDWVSFDGGDHQVIALAGTSVRLRAHDGAEQMVLASYLMAAPDFAITGGALVPRVEPLGLLDSLPGEVLAAAREWERHVVEVETGLAPDAEPGTGPHADYDPQARTLAQRMEAKAAELGVGYRTVERMRAQYADQGLWGLVDRRAVRAHEATGRADTRLVAVARQVIEAETHTSTGTGGTANPPDHQSRGRRLRSWRRPAAGPVDVLQAGRRPRRGAAHVRVGG
jgi:putative transposase